MGQLDGTAVAYKTGNSHGYRHSEEAAEAGIEREITVQCPHLGKQTCHQHDDPHPDIGGQPPATDLLRRQRVNAANQQHVEQQDIEGVNPEAFHRFLALILPVFALQASREAQPAHPGHHHPS